MSVGEVGDDDAAPGPRKRVAISEVVRPLPRKPRLQSSSPADWNVIPARDPKTGEMALTFPTTSGTTYLIQYSDDLTGGWQELQVMTADADQVSATIKDFSASAQSQRFYQVTVSGAAPTVTPTPTVVPTPTPVPTVTATPTPTPGLGPTPTPTATAPFIPPVGPLTPTPTLGPLASNAAPLVSAGSNKLAVVNQTVQLVGTATDDGKPIGGTLTTYWTIVGGPVPVTPSNPSQLNTTVAFSEPGSYTARLTASDSELSISSEATITVSARPDLAFSSARSTRGTEFWIAFPGIGYNVIPTPTFVERPAMKGAGSGARPDTLTPITDAIPNLSVLIAAEQGATGTVQAPGLSWSQSFTIAPGATMRISVPAAAMVSSNDYIENKGVFIQCDRPVTVFAIGRRDLYSQKNPAFPAGDVFQPRLADSVAAYLVHPVPSLGQSYRIVAPGTFRGSGFTVVATDDDTVVAIDLVVSYATRTAGLPYQINLQRGQTYQFRTNSPVYGEETGTMVTSSKPIVVIGGNDFRGDPLAFANTYAAQLSPTTMGGTQFVVRRLDLGLASTVFEVTVMATEGEATVFLNGEEAGKAFEWSPLVLSLTGTNRLQTDNQVQVVESTRNLVVDIATNTRTASYYMTTVPSAADGSTSYLLAPLADEYAITLATITIGDAARSSLRLNNAMVDGALFSPIANTDLFTAQIPLSSGPSLLTADKPFRAWLSASAPIVYKTGALSHYLDTYIAAFATPAGLEFGELEADSTLVLVNDPQQIAPGQTATVTTRALNGSGKPLGGVRIEYAMTGANPAAGHAYSDFQGYANFQYVGQTAGTDLVVASAGRRVAQGQVVWGFGAPPPTPTPALLTPTPLPTRHPVPTITPTPSPRPGTPTRTPTPVPGINTPTPTPVSIGQQFVNVYLLGGSGSMTIFRGQPVRLSATVDRPALVTDFYISSNDERLPDFVDPNLLPEAYLNTRVARWFPRSVGDYEVKVVATPVAGAIINSVPSLVLHVVEPPVDPSLPRTLSFTARGIGPTEVVLKWPYTLAGENNLGLIIERRRADQAEWRMVGMFDRLNSRFFSELRDQMLFTVDRSLSPSTDYLYRFSYVTTDGRRSQTSDEIPARTLAPFPRFAVIDLTAQIEYALAESPILRQRFHRGGNAKTSGGVIELGDGRPIAINAKAQAVVEQVINGMKTYWFWDPLDDMREIPGGPAGSGGFIATGLAEDGRVSGRWDTGERNTFDGSIRYHAAYWEPGAALPVDLTPMDTGPNIEVLRKYFDDIAFRDLPNVIPMSWSANGITADGLVAGMVTRNKGHNPPGGNANYAARWSIGANPIDVEILDVLPGAPDSVGFDGSINAMAASGMVAGSTIKDALLFGADPRNQNDHYHAFYSSGPGNPATDLGTGGGWHSEGWGINSSGQVTGVTTISEADPYWRTQAFLSTGYGAAISQVLPTLGGINDNFLAGYGYALAVSEDGWVVGQSLAGAGHAPPGLMGENVSYGCLWKKNSDGEYEVIPLHKLAQVNDWVFDIGTVVNNAKLIGAVGYRQIDSGGTGPNNKRAAILFPFELGVDSDADGFINLANNPDATKGLDETSKDQPYRFWINDDTDSDVGGEIIPPSVRDCDDFAIGGKRDLEDLTRLRVFLGPFANLVSSGQLLVGLKWVGTDGTTPAINIFQHVEVDGGTSYLSNDSVATLQTTFPVNMAMLAEPLVQRRVDTSSTFIIGKAYWSSLNPALPIKHLLLEGCASGKGQLVLTLHRPNRVEIGQGGGVWLRLADANEMILRATASPQNILGPYDNPAEAYSGPQPYWLLDDAEGSFEPDARETNKAILFVHGWSVSRDYYLSFSQTMFKRLWHQGFRGRFCTLRWDTIVANEVFNFTASPGQFNRSEHRAWLYGGALRSFAQAINRGGYDVTLIGHSMGNIVCGSALRQGLQVTNYLAMEAAVPAGCFDESGVRGSDEVNSYARFWDAEDTSPTPDFDALPNGEFEGGYRGFLKGIRTQVSGQIVNFHNSLDFALATGFMFFGTTEANWEANQLNYKPDGNFSVAWRYRYDTSAANFGDRSILEQYVTGTSPHWSFIRNVPDSWERKAFIARPRSKALGAVTGIGTSTPGLPFNEHINMQNDFGFDGRDSDHSGQFNRTNMEVSGLYLRIFNIVSPPSS